MDVGTRDGSVLSTLFFSGALIFYIVWGCLKDADIEIDGLKYYLYLSVILSTFCIILKGRFSFWGIILFLFVAGMGLYFKQVHLDPAILPICFLIFSANNIKIDYIVKVFFYSLLVLTSLIILMSFLGVLSDKVQTHGIGDEILESHALGFKWYSGPTFRAITLIISYLYLNRGKANYLQLACVLFVSIVLVLITTRRLLLLISITTVVLYWLSYRLRILEFNSKFWKFVSLFAYPVAFAFYIILAFSTFISPSFYEWYDDNTSGRLSLTLAAFVQYPITLWGNVVDLVGAIEAEYSSLDYNYIDSGYIYWLLVYGVLFCLFIVISHIVIIYRSYKSQNKFLYIWCLLLAFMNISNDFFTASYLNPIIFLLLAKFPKIDLHAKYKIILH